ncbi:MAG: hypothetical protein PVI57_11495 [Gemmatimonadota bacterium]|jgi:hypothetical protein
MRSLVFLATLATVSSTPLHAQQSAVDDHGPSVGVREWSRLEGQRLRIVGPGVDSSTALEGVLMRSSGDTLLLAVRGLDSPVSVVTSSGVVVEWWRRSDPTRGSSILGGVLGLAAGGVIANHLNDPPAPKRCERSFDDAWSAVGCAVGASLASDLERRADQIVAVWLGMAVGGVAGALAGNLIGRSMIDEGWRPVKRSPIRIAPTPRGQLQLGIRLVH